MANILLNIFSPIILPYRSRFPQAVGDLFEFPADTPLSADFFLLIRSKTALLCGCYIHLHRCNVYVVDFFTTKIYTETNADTLQPKHKSISEGVHYEI